MRHYTALQNGPDGPWHYVSVGDKGGHPTEGCDPSCTHETADEAFEHHRQWCLDHLRFDSSEPDTQRRCEECGEFTTRRVVDGDSYGSFVLCDDHATREVMERRHYPEGAKLESWRS